MWRKISWTDGRTDSGATIDGRNLIFGLKLHIGTPYYGKRFLTHQIPTSCLSTLLIFIHIEHICSFFSATIDGRNLIFGLKLHIGTPYHGKCFWTHQIPTSCLSTLLIIIHIEHICSFFSATIDSIPLPPSGSKGIKRENTMYMFWIFLLRLTASTEIDYHNIQSIL
jgi:hypothetical protein